jgi:hypothetical protein
MVQYTSFVLIPWSGEIVQATVLTYLQMDYRGVYSVLTDGKMFISLDLHELFGAE